MNKILVVITYHLLRNKTFAQFLKDLVVEVERIGPGAVGVKAIYDVLKPASAELEARLDLIRKSGITALIEEQDHYRDGIVKALVALSRAHLSHPDATRREAARLVTMVLDHYGNVPRETYDDESAAIDDVLRELTSTTYAPHVTTLALGPLVTQLSDANAKFFELMHERYAEETTRPTTSMRDLRATVEHHLRALTDRVEAAATLLGLDSNPDLAEFVKEYNAIATRYKHILAQEKGRRAAAASKDEDDDALVDEGTQTGEDEPVEE